MQGGRLDDASSSMTGGRLGDASKPGARSEACEWKMAWGEGQADHDLTKLIWREEIRGRPVAAAGLVDKPRDVSAETVQTASTSAGKCIWHAWVRSSQMLGQLHYLTHTLLVV